jgi:hypothetical protein
MLLWFLHFFYFFTEMACNFGIFFNGAFYTRDVDIFEIYVKFCIYWYLLIPCCEKNNWTLIKWRTQTFMTFPIKVGWGKKLVFAIFFIFEWNPPHLRVTFVQNVNQLKFDLPYSPISWDYPFQYRDAVRDGPHKLNFTKHYAEENKRRTFYCR